MQDRHWISRTTALIGEEALNKLNNSHVLVVGLGGIGSFAAEFIARAGVGKLTIVDGDVVDPTNRNRQIQAMASTHGMSKADLIISRLCSALAFIVFKLKLCLRAWSTASSIVNDFCA